MASEVLLAALLFAVDIDLLGGYEYTLGTAFGFVVSSREIYRLLQSLFGVFLIGVVLTLAQTRFLREVQTRMPAALTLFIVVAVLLRQRPVWSVFRRILTGQISAELRLGDILVSDGLVSLSGVLVDLALCINLLVRGVPISTPLNRPHHIGPLTQLVACVPATIRMSQCVHDFRRSHQSPHLFNFVKYSIGNVVNLLRVAAAMKGADRAAIHRYLMLFLYVNAVYSVFWDIFMDWKLQRIASTPTRIALPWYALAAAADSLMRFSFLISSDGEQAVYGLQVLEIIRRGIWIIFRVDSEDEGVMPKLG